MNDATACPRCGLPDAWRDDPVTLNNPMRVSLERDLVDLTSWVVKRARAGDRQALGAARVLEALRLAVHRKDAAALDGLAIPAMQLLRSQRSDEVVVYDGEELLDNAAAVRRLIAQAQRALDDSAPQSEGRSFKVMLAMRNALSTAFPGLPGVRDDAAARVAERRISSDARRSDADAAWLAERALIHAGMPAREAHQRFAFVRMAAHRDAKRPERKRRNRRGRL